MEWLDARHIAYESVDVLADAAAYEEMIKLSGQQKTPTLQTEDHRVLADFDVAELALFLKQA